MTALRLAHASDLHCCERNRLDDWIGLHQILVEQVHESRCDLALLTGDLFHAKSTPAERNAMAGFLLRLADMCPVLIVKGNHDAADDLDIFSCLSARYPITVRDRPGTDVIETPNGAVAVYSIPWFDRAHLVAGLSATVDSEATRNLTIDAARQLLTVARAHVDQARDKGYLPILVGHLMVAGSETSTGQTLIGTTVELSPGDLADVGAEYVAIGHVHKRQTWSDGRISYAGSTWPQNFGEDHPHGWNLVTFEDGGFVSNEFVELPARRIVLIEADYTDPLAPVVTGGGTDDLRGALVRYRYRVSAQHLHSINDADIEEGLRRAGAHEVTLEAVKEQETRVRSEAIVSAKSNFEKVKATLDAKGITPDAATLERIAAKLAEIESRAREEVAA